MAASRCFMFTYLLLRHWVPATSQPSTDWHQGRVAIWETAHHTGAAANLQVEPLNRIIGADSGLVLTGQITVGQHFLNTIFHLLSGLFQLHRAEFFHHGLAFSLVAFCSLERGLP